MWIGTIIPLLCGCVVTQRTAHFDPDVLFQTVAAEGDGPHHRRRCLRPPHVAALDAADAGALTLAALPLSVPLG